MNRDEQRTRPRALPPAIRQIGSRTVLYPHEPSGGTWIGVNDSAVTLALINWYSVSKQFQFNPLSRGTIIPSLLACSTSRSLEAAIRSLSLDHVYPFRLITIHPGDRSLTEWRWNQEALESISHRWQPKAWFSSAVDEPGAQRHRSSYFRSALLKLPPQHDGPEAIGWLRKLHSSHFPSRGVHSICMHRPDAATVSYTDLLVTDERIEMFYSSRCLCNAERAGAFTGVKARLEVRVDPLCDRAIANAL